MAAPMGKGAISQGQRGKEETAFSYFKAVQSDLNKRFNKIKGMIKKSSPSKEK